MKDDNKFYSPEEAAAKVLDKIKELYKNSSISKSNTAHEIELGEEPRNDDAECPASLAEGSEGFEGSSEEDKKKKNPFKGSSETDEYEEMDEGSEEEQDEDAAKYEKDEEDGDIIENDEEIEDPEEDEDPKKIIKEASEDKKEKKKMFEKNMNNDSMGAPIAKKGCEDGDIEEEGMEIDIKKPSKLKSFMDKKNKKKKMKKNLVPEDAPQRKQAKQTMQKPQEKAEGPAGSGY